MAALRALASGAGSASFDEARVKSVEFFRVVCRSLPNLVELYNLHDVTTVAELRSRAAQLFRRHAGVTNAKVVDMLLYKGQEELTNLETMSKQRHHILSQYIVGPNLSIQANQVGIRKKEGETEFLQRFYLTNL
ncbi:NADH dehydrogenase (ubiquinone) 1 alpha subcomplex 6 [Klebsormidium nitens]|uniref:NADH dehydrogenase (Ubiquinone) 1 alpha subcomplex 6 n=1 Tax=Klebsormidium nitens TaxID=105231 RepID=A0A1Y1HRX2_KLENI|nr:NADH dehydrogenase (ubiquinone) 1 alpha subcomplex 6 [Klebsormidium nitens]|eukprot:GAQ81385.1 NADH dehydrogenase (ubiquinone) 1 alpha subcomplex 6 [Klebsormidium nitens]